jgi:hypothetical protein
MVYGEVLIIDPSVYVHFEYVKYIYREKFRIDMYKALGLHGSED